MNQILRKFVPKKILFFLDDVLIKNYKDEDKDLILEENGFYTFIKEYIEEVERILKRLEEDNFTLFLEKFTFGF